MAYRRELTLFHSECILEFIGVESKTAQARASFLLAATHYFIYQGRVILSDFLLYFAPQSFSFMINPFFQY